MTPDQIRSVPRSHLASKGTTRDGKVKPASDSKSLFLSLLSAVFLALSFPKFNLSFLAWVGLLPLFFAIEGKSPKKAFLLSLLCGFLFFLITVYWLIHVTLPGWILLCLYLGIYFGLFGLIFSILSSRPKVLLFFVLPGIWVITEYLRAHLLTGFGWALLGYSQYRFLPVIQIADITGAYGVSFFVVLTNLAIYYRSRDKNNSRQLLVIYSILAVIIFTYGFLKLSLGDSLKKLKVAVIQGNIPHEWTQDWQWQENKKQFILDKYSFLTYIASRENPDLIVWPETAFPGFLWQGPDLFSGILDLARKIERPILFGAVTASETLIHNSALLVSPRGEPGEIYHKLHLVPFGEYIPLRNALPFLGAMVPVGDFTAGKEYTVFTLTPNPYLLPTRFSVLICFEDAVAELSRGLTLSGAEFLIDITNDAWFKDTSAPYQHLQSSVFRAVENHRPIIRSANTGVSGFIDANGRIDGLVEQHGKNTFVDGFLAQEISPQARITFYTRFGDIFVVICCILVVLGVAKKIKLKC